MQRVDEVFNILENSFEIYRNKHFPIASITEKFPLFSVVQPFDKNQFQLIFQKRDQFTNISQIFTDNEFKNQFDISKIQKIKAIIQSPKISYNELLFFADYALNQYISFIIQYEKNNSLQGIDILFNLLSDFSNLDFQNIINESIRDLICIISNNITIDLFDTMFIPISDYFLSKVVKHSPSSLLDDRKTFSLIPFFLKRLFELDGFEDSTECEKVHPFLAMMFLDDAKYFTNETFLGIYNVIRPYLDNLNKTALIIMKDLVNYLDKDIVLTYFKELPYKFEKIVENEPDPCIPSPIYINNEEKEEETDQKSTERLKSSIIINPSQSPECLFRFSNVSSFINGLDLSHNPCDYLPKTFDLRKIFWPKYFYLIDLISKSLIRQIINHDDESQIFVDSFTTFIDQRKQGNKYEFDYICILIFYWIKLDIRRIKLPKNLLNPATSLSIEKVENDSKKYIYYTINYLTLMKILQNGESCFDSILMSYVKYPHFLAEIFEICFLQITNLSAMISQHTWIVRTFRLIALQLQTSEFGYLTPDLPNEKKIEKDAFFIEVVEEARLSLFRLFSELFQYNSFLKLFLSDFLFLSFFLSLLFEVNIRKFVLEELEKYLKCDISKENLNKFSFQLTQMINQIYPSLNDDKEGLFLLEDIVKMMNSVKMLLIHNIEQLQPFCQALTTTFDFLDETEYSRTIFYEILTLFSVVPGIELDSIETPLKKYGILKKDEYQTLINLLASKIMSENVSEFEIKNGNLMNIMFRVFHEHSEVDIIGLSTKLCTHSHQNCFILHRSNYDILILDYVLKHRNDDDIKSQEYIPKILNNLVLISSVVSSPAVVRKFISLFIPIDNRYISNIHQFLLSPLKTILERSHDIPSSTFSLSQAVSISIDSMKQQLEKDSFSFTCWIYFEGSHFNHERINILTLLNNDMKPFFNFSLDGNVFVIQDKNTNIQMPKKSWEFISIIYNDGKVQLFIENQEICVINVIVKFPFGLVTVCIGGINNNNNNDNFVAQICNINIFPLHFPQLPEIIYKHGPRGTQKKFKCLLSFDQTSMTKIAGYSTHAQNRNFADILLRFFKVEILLPFFAQVDLTRVDGKSSNFNIIDIVSVFKEALSSGEMEQIEFYKKHGFSIISHLLIFSSPKQISYELYLKFYDIYEILLSEEIKKDMFKNILINFDIWIVAEHQDHMKILVHWRTLIPRYYSFFIEFFKFSRLLEIMRTYYWYTPIEKDKIRCEPQNNSNQDNENKILQRIRNPNLKISEVRSMMFNILYEISKLQFSNEDFSTFMDHCLNIRDKKQKYDLLCFMNTIANADFLPFQQITNTLQTLSRISILLHSDDKKVICIVLNIICSVHMHCETQVNDFLSLDSNLEALIKNIEISSMNVELLNELLILINQKIYNLFPICTYVSYVIGEIKLYQEVDPSQYFVVCPNWEIWSVCEALNQKDLHSSFTIFQFLVCCSHKEWKNIYDTIEIVGQAMKMDEIKIDQYKTTFLKVVCLCILNMDTSIPSEVFDSLFSLLKQHIFYRVKDENKTYSRALESLYKKSPFYSQEEQILNKINEEKNQLETQRNILNQENFLRLNLKKHEYKFGFNINENLTWADKDIAQQILMLVTKFREKTKNSIGFAIIIAAFLCHCCIDFVKSQMCEIQLTEEETITFSQEVDFLFSKLKGISFSFQDTLFENDPDIEFLMKKKLSITEIMRNASFILDNLEINNLNNDEELSYIKLYNIFVKYNVESCEKLSIVEGKTKIYSGINSDTEINSSFNEESSTDKENGSFLSSDDIEINEHEEENNESSESENYNKIIDLREEIRDRIEINSKRWKTLWSNVVMDGAPWDSSLITGKPTIIRWKRDNTLCSFYCPFKMKRNQHPNNHIDASFARDAGCYSAATKLLEDHNQRLQKEYLKSAPPILLEIDQPSSSLNVINSPVVQRALQSQRNIGSNNLKRKKKVKSTSIMLISPENSFSLSSNTIGNILRRRKNNPKRTFSFECEYLKISKLKKGKLIFANDNIHFIEENEKTLVIKLKNITHVFMRNRFHIKSAIEIFLLSGKTYLFNFPNNKSIDILQKILISIQRLDINADIQTEESPKYFKNQKFTDDWVSGKMSNFEYLMKLNIYSERTFNDASQYPFFPWVLSNYTSGTIDLKDPNNYRDLSKPIGAMNEERLNELLQRMNDMSFFAGSSFLYSSFAICPLSVYLWFVRIEPFTTLHIMMQSSKFDHPSRLFSSIPTSYKLVTTHLNDYRELPPEFFFMPEFLFNDNEFDLGTSHGKKINDVILPNWIEKNDFKSGAEFVYTLRKALESDEVSLHLNEWIDLFWGIKQRGEEAKKSLNLYNPNMYETAWTPKTLKDPQKRAEIESTMCHVGQVPPRIFTEPHPQRILVKNINNENNQTTISLSSSLISRSFIYCEDSSSFIFCLFGSKLINGGIEKRFVSQVKASINNENQSSLTVTNVRDIEIKNEVLCIGFQSFLGQIIASQSTGKLVHFVQNVKTQTSLEAEFLIPELSNVSHFTSKEEFFAVVSDDATLNLYVFGRHLEFKVEFYGDQITCLDVSKPFKVCACGTFSGRIVLCSLFEGKKVCVIPLVHDASTSLGIEISQLRPVKVLVTESWGFVLTYSEIIDADGNSRMVLFLHNINGRFIRCVDVGKIRISCWSSFKSRKDFDYVIMANEKGMVFMFEAFYLDLGQPIIKCYKKVVAVACSIENKVAVAVKEDGNAIVSSICID